MLRREYMQDVSLHHTYYRQFATPAVIKAVRKEFGEELAECEHPFNELALERWYRLMPVVPDVLFRQCGDFPSDSGKVCALKAAARIVRDEE